MCKIWLFLLFLKLVSSARILGYFPMPSYSHQIIYQPIWKELSLQGHQVTVITANPLKEKSLKNLREIDVQELSYEIWTRNDISKSVVQNDSDPLDFSLMNKAMFEFMEAQLNHPEVRDIVTNKNKEKYDLLLVEFMIPYGMIPYALIDVYNCPMIGVSSMPLMTFTNIIIGNPVHPVRYPDGMLPFSRKMTFFERLQSTLYTIFGPFIFKNVFDVMQTMTEKHFGSNVRSLDDLQNEVSLILTNTNPILHIPRPNIPGVIEFSGIHIKPEQPLPKDLKDILDNSKNGVIYTSFGTNVKSSSMPDYKLQLIIDTFAELPYTILWKFETDNIPNIPKNVIIRKWFPQQDILRHSNLKLFITQGGAQSLDEAMYSKTPVIVIPFLADQFSNAKKIDEVGLGKQLKFATLNIEEFKATILEVLDEKYAKRAEDAHKILIDVPMSPIDTCIWWIEFVLRHKNVSHMKSPLRTLPWYQYLFLDVLSFVLICLLSVIYVIYKIFKYIKKIVNFSKVKQN